MTPASKRRLDLRIALVLTSAALSIAALLHADWIELVLRIDPDQGNGAEEWLLAAVPLAAAGLLSAHSHAVRRRRDRTHRATGDCAVNPRR
jgi:hypothetical protein